MADRQRSTRGLPRGRCPVCRGDIALRKGGLLREHPDHRHELYSVAGAVRDGRVPKCQGSGLDIAEMRG